MVFWLTMVLLFLNGQNNKTLKKEQRVKANILKAYENIEVDNNAGKPDFAIVILSMTNVNRGTIYESSGI